MNVRGVIGVMGIVLLGGGAEALAAQSGFGITPMAQGIVTVDQVHETPGGGPLTEAHVVQPVLMAIGHGFGQLLQFTATLDLEGLTMPGGELAPGDWGEGFIDRRHPMSMLRGTSAAIAPLVSLTIARRLSENIDARLIWDRVTSSYNRDADIFLLGLGFSWR